MGGNNRVTLARLAQKLDDNLIFMNKNQYRLEKQIEKDRENHKHDIKEITTAWTVQKKDIYTKIDKNKDGIHSVKMFATTLGSLGGILGGFLGGFFRK